MNLEFFFQRNQADSTREQLGIHAFTSSSSPNPSARTDATTNGRLRILQEGRSKTRRNGARRRPAAVLLWVSLAAIVGVGCTERASKEVGSDAQIERVPDAQDSAETSRPDVEGPLSRVGEACTESAPDCEGGICSKILPGGYCLLPCDESACPSGSDCRELNNFPFCLAQCESDADCRAGAGYACIDGVCNIACAADADCLIDQTCQQSRCVDPSRDKDVGEACTWSKECLSGACLLEADGGVCGEACDNSPCTLAGWDCRPMVPQGTGTARALCSPNPPFSIDTLVLTGPSPYAFEVPLDAVSFLIVAEGADSNGNMGIEHLRRPDGTLAAGAIGSGMTAPFQMTIGQGHASAELPNNADPALQVIPGVWSFDVLTDRAQSVEQVTVFIRRQAAVDAVRETSFDLNIYLPQGVLPGLNASTALDNAEVQGALARMANTYWETHGLLLGNVQYFDIPGEFVNVSTEAELHRMFAEQTAGHEGALNVFMVRDLLNGEAAGIAGGIPGSVGVPGTGGSAVAVQLQGGGAGTGDNMSHELGHFIGLYHVTEIYGDLSDVIVDTPKCKVPPYTMRDTRDPCMGNIMFPMLLTGMVPQSFSATQGLIYRLNPQGK